MNDKKDLAAPQQHAQSSENDWLVENLFKAMCPLRDVAGQVHSNAIASRDGLVFSWPLPGITELQWIAFGDAANKLLQHYKPMQQHAQAAQYGGAQTADIERKSAVSPLGKGDSGGAQAALSDEQIDAVWESMPGGPDAWLRNFGYQQFARAILATRQPAPVADDHQAFIDSLDGEDKMFEQIDRWARESYRRHKSSVRGQQITHADGENAHIIWATLRWAKENAVPVAAAVAQDRYIAAIDGMYPIPNSPHNSVVQRAMNDRIAFRKGWESAIAVQPPADAAPSPHSIGYNDDLPEGWKRAPDGRVIPPAGIVGEAYTVGGVQGDPLSQQAAQHDRPEDTDWAYQQGRAAGIEEAAKACHERAAQSQKRMQESPSIVTESYRADQVRRDEADACMSAIRALNKGG